MNRPTNNRYVHFRTHARTRKMGVWHHRKAHAARRASSARKNRRATLPVVHHSLHQTASEERVLIRDRKGTLHTRKKQTNKKANKTKQNTKLSTSNLAVCARFLGSGRRHRTYHACPCETRTKGAVQRIRAECWSKVEWPGVEPRRAACVRRRAKFDQSRSRPHRHGINAYGAGKNSTGELRQYG